MPAGQQDYINASPITLQSILPARPRPSKEKSLEYAVDVDEGVDRYVSMQGPKQNTIHHTWRMIIEQLNSPAVIVMLTSADEGDYEKCYPYFPRSPEDAPLEIGIENEFSDDFRASVRCAATEETEAGDAIDLR